MRSENWVENLAIADFHPMTGGVRCVSEESCLAFDNNLVSQGDESSGMPPSCRHCGEECINCMENEDGLLMCMECDYDLFILGDKCVDVCPDSPCWRIENK